MQITVLYFAALRDLTGRGQDHLEVPPTEDSVDRITRFIEIQIPELRGRLQGVRIACNEAFAEPGDTVQDGDVIALIPPVSGG